MKKAVRLPALFILTMKDQMPGCMFTIAVTATFWDFFIVL